MGRLVHMTMDRLSEDDRARMLLGKMRHASLLLKVNFPFARV